jgi:hypothetical protein
MKRIAVLCFAAAVGAANTAQAQLTMQMTNGWSFTFAGNVNAFLTYQFSNNSDTAVVTGGAVPTGQGAFARIRTGLLPAFAVFEAKGKELGQDVTVHFGFAPQINSPGVHDAFGAQIDMRQVYLQVGGTWGSILAGRELGLFQRENILTDMTLFGTGAFGGSLGAGGTTLGRIGFGYVYPNFNAQLTYSTPATTPIQWSIGLFDPSAVAPGTAGAGNALFPFTPIPRVETELSYTSKFGQAAEGAPASTDQALFWVGGAWQKAYANPGDTGTSINSEGVDAGIKVDISKISLMGSGYYGKGIGTTLMFTVLPVDATGVGRKSYGYIGQAVFKLDPKWNVGASWGQSILDATDADKADGAAGALLKANSMGVGTIVYQATKSLKVVGEYDWTQASNHNGGKNKVSQAAAGMMVFF